MESMQEYREALDARRLEKAQEDYQWASTELRVALRTIEKMNEEIGRLSERLDVLHGCGQAAVALIDEIRCGETCSAEAKAASALESSLRAAGYLLSSSPPTPGPND